jgi:hypothetical protein
VSGLEERLEKQREEHQATQQALASLQARLREAEQARTTELAIYALTTLVVLLLCALGVVVWRLMRVQTQRHWAEDARALNEFAPAARRSERVAAAMPPLDEATMTSMRVPPDAPARAPAEEPPPPAAEARRPVRARPALREVQPAVDETPPPFRDTEPPVVDAPPPVHQPRTPLRETLPAFRETQPPLRETPAAFRETQPPLRETPAAFRETRPPLRDTQASLRETQPLVRQTQPPVREALPFGHATQPFGHDTQAFRNDLPTTVPTAARSRREPSPEELVDLEQQADFFIALGQEDSAIDLLMDHVRSSGGTSPMPYLKLLEIYRRRGEDDAYERIRERFNRRFNGHAPPWEAPVPSHRTLASYPAIVQRIEAAWKNPYHAVELLQALVFRRDASNGSFELPAFEELLFLYTVARDLYEHSATPGGVDLLLPLGEDEPQSITRATAAHDDVTRPPHGWQVPAVDLELDFDFEIKPPPPRTR